MGVGAGLIVAVFGRIDDRQNLKTDLEEEMLVFAVQSPDCKPRAPLNSKKIALMSWGEDLLSLSCPASTDDADHELEPPWEQV